VEGVYLLSASITHSNLNRPASLLSYMENGSRLAQLNYTIEVHKPVPGGAVNLFEKAGNLKRVWPEFSIM